MPSSGETCPQKKRLLDPSLLLFVIGINSVFLFYVQVALGFQIVRFINLYSVGYFCLFFSMLCAFFEEKMRYFRSIYQKWLWLLFVYFGFISILSIINLDLSKSVWHTSSDVFAIFCFSGIFVAGKIENWKVIEKILVLHFALSTILCIFFTLTYGHALLYSEVLVSPIFQFWGLQYGWPYFLLTLNTGGFLRKIVAIVGVCTFFVLSVFFLKKSPFAQGVFLIGISLVINIFVIKRKMLKRLKFHRILASTGLLIFFALVILSGVKVMGLDSITEEYGEGYGVHGLYGRFMQYGSIYNTVLADYRITYEGKAVLEDISFFEMVFGRGIGATIPVDDLHSSEGIQGELHNGMAKLFLKGGILLLIIWYVGWLFMIIDLMKYRQEWLIPCYSIIIMTVLFSLVNNFFYNGLGFILVMLCAGRCMSKSALPSSCS